MDGSLYALNFGTGKQEWKFTSDTTGINNTGNSMGRGSPVDVPVPLTPEEYIYAGSNNGYFYCLSAANGSMYWKYFTVGKVFTSPAVESGCVYVSPDYSSQAGNDGGMIYCFPMLMTTPSLSGNQTHFTHDQIIQAILQ